MSDIWKEEENEENKLENEILLGFEDLFKRMLQIKRNVTYPPFDIEEVDDKRFKIVIAVAGFDKSEIEVFIEEEVQLTIRGKKKSEENKKYIHKGIAKRSFTRSFIIERKLEIIDVRFGNGLLEITLEKKPSTEEYKLIPIKDM